MEEKEKKQKLQEKYMEMQMISQQMQQLQKQAELVDNQTQDLNITKEALNEISKTKTGTEILSPLASGIFVKGQITDNKEVLVNVGSNTTVKKTIPDSVKLLDNQLIEIINFKKELELNITKLAAKAQQIEKELSELSKNV